MHIKLSDDYINLIWELLVFPDQKLKDVLAVEKKKKRDLQAGIAYSAIHCFDLSKK